MRGDRGVLHIGGLRRGGCLRQECRGSRLWGWVTRGWECVGQTRWLGTSADRRWISGRCILGSHGGETYRERGQADFASLHILRRGGLREHAHGARALHPALRSRPEREWGPDADASRGHLLLSLLPLVCVCVCGPDAGCLTTRAVRVCIPWRATVYERCRLRCSCVCTRLWSAGCEKALRLLMMTSLVGGRGSFFFSRLSIEELG